MALRASLMMYDCGRSSDSDSFYQTQMRQFMRQELWSEAGGYVEAVLDDRHPDYIRFYPGQSSRLALRIACAHARRIANWQYASTPLLRYGSWPWTPIRAISEIMEVLFSQHINHGCDHQFKALSTLSD